MSLVDYLDLRNYTDPGKTLQAAQNIVNILTGSNSGSSSLSGSLSAGTDPSAPASVQIEQIKSEARAIIESGRNAVRDMHRLRSLIRDLEESLVKPYVFDVFPEYTVAYGLLYTFRQKWEPGDFQVGKLLATIPLAPRETRKIQKRVFVRETRQTKELRRSVRNLVNETTSASTASSEIVKRAEASNTANVTASGSYGNDELYKVAGQATLTRDAKILSSDTKKAIREQTLKALQEIREEREIQIESTSEQTVEETSSGEISNPNEEITVTYLYYELGRQFTLSESLHKVTPVVFVANPFPAPSDIDRSWLVEYEWILRRVILDNAFLPAFDLLKRSPDGDLLSVNTLQVAMEIASRAVAETRDFIATQERLKDQASRRVDAAVERLASVQAGQDSEGFVEKFGEFFTGSSGSESNDAAATRKDAAENFFSRIEDSIAAARNRLAQVESALQSATREYVEALRSYMDALQQIAALRVHVKQNATYYMQAIWKHEHRDQRYFRLFDKLVPFIPLDSTAVATATDGAGNVTITLPPSSAPVEWPLESIADLDRMLGFLGNYMIFPLTSPCHITTAMLTGFLNDELQLVDPDASSNGISVAELDDAKITITVQRDALPSGDPSRALYDHQLAELDAVIAAIGRDSDLLSGEQLVIVPTDMLYIEALPGNIPVLEHFKLTHRQLDAEEVRAKVKQAEINNLRMAALLRSGNLFDPEIDKQIFINSTAPLGGTFDPTQSSGDSSAGDSG